MSNIDRRNKEDRRQAESGPPTGWRERRRMAERRTIAVSEISFDEWLTSMANLLPRMSRGEREG